MRQEPNKDQTSKGAYERTLIDSEEQSGEGMTMRLRCKSMGNKKVGKQEKEAKCMQ